MAEYIPDDSHTFIVEANWQIYGHTCYYTLLLVHRDMSRVQNDIFADPDIFCGPDIVHMHICRVNKRRINECNEWALLSWSSHSVCSASNVLSSLPNKYRFQCIFIICAELLVPSVFRGDRPLSWSRINNIGCIESPIPALSSDDIKHSFLTLDLWRHRRASAVLATWFRIVDCSKLTRLCNLLCCCLFIVSFFF